MVYKKPLFAFSLCAVSLCLSARATSFDDFRLTKQAVACAQLAVRSMAATDGQNMTVTTKRRTVSAVGRHADENRTPYGITVTVDNPYNWLIEYADPTDSDPRFRNIKLFVVDKGVSDTVPKNLKIDPPDLHITAQRAIGVYKRMVMCGPSFLTY
jgi:hypothetical protein